LASWLAGWLAWLAGWMPGWLTGWLDACWVASGRLAALVDFYRFSWICIDFYDFLVIFLVLHDLSTSGL
jgi:hypothetical protein